MARELREVVYVDGVRTAFGKAGPSGLFWKTRADDMAVKAVRELLRRNPQAPPERIGDVVMAATAQVGDQGLTLGREVDLFAKEAIPFLRLFRPGILAASEDVGRAGAVLARAAMQAIRAPGEPPLQELDVPRDGLETIDATL